ncbi:NAD(P)-binding protein [Obba rivulosa]|uniref:NAD(P)-binding protein n=1 Tax=Obba rivulosa TaxID=1052685 RepID=A0A8E2DQG5_9APHY|nr:NAD(P)-binding protein [Obba rivulosa]
MGLWLLIAAVFVLAYLYVRTNDSKLAKLSPEASALTPERWNAKAVQNTAAMLADSPYILRAESLPPRTGRRYIVVGGAGFLGGWIILHLLARGEDPHRIRCLDIALPTRVDLKEGAAKDVDFLQVDVTDADALEAAFEKPWSSSSLENPGITVFHTAASFRYYERVPSLLPYSELLNVRGTQNIVNAARKAGASVLVYTSSGSLLMRPTRFWLWPWEKKPEYVVQVISDETRVPQRFEEFFSNYAVTKRTAESIVSEADKTPSVKGVLRTGCIRPGNAIYGPRGQLMVGQHVLQKVNPTWSGNVVSSFVYVENCSLAHLLYEQRLLDAAQVQDIGGQAFCVTDSGPAPTYGDVHTAINILTGGETVFPSVSPTMMLILAHLFEGYYLIRHFLLRSPLANLSRLLPPLNSVLVTLQPSTYALATIHLVFDDSRARLPPEKGGLGYTSCTTMEGICKVVLEHKKRGGKI